LNRERTEKSDAQGPQQAPAVQSTSVATRLVALLILGGCLAVLGVAVALKPDPRGYGTHEQLGGGPCGMLVMTGLPCPTCGMTTAFANTVRGQWLQALRAQPAGFVLALATLGMAVLCGWVLVRGRWPVIERFVAPYALFVVLLVLLVGGWAAKIVIGFMDGTLPYH